MLIISSRGRVSQISARKTGARDIEGGGDDGGPQESYEVESELARGESRGVGLVNRVRPKLTNYGRRVRGAHGARAVSGG